MDKVKRFSEICEKILKTYAEKNQDYGDSFGISFAEFGPIAGIVRMGDKYNRIKNLTLNVNNPMVKDESIKDTLLDLATYSIMLAMEIDIHHENETPQT